MNIDNIISEAINKFIDETIIVERARHRDTIKKLSALSDKGDEFSTHLKNALEKDIKSKNKEHSENVKSKKKSKKKSLKDIVKKGKKLKNGLRTDFNAKQDRETNPNLNNQDAEDLNDILDSDYIDVAALARDIYPDHTPEGAQSQLRKKIKGIENDNGSKYKLKKKEAYKIRRAIARELK